MMKKRGEAEVLFRHRLFYLCELHHHADIKTGKYDLPSRVAAC